MRKYFGFSLLFAVLFFVPGAKANPSGQQSASTTFTAVPVPASAPAPTITKLVPASSYVTSLGFSQDGITFVQSEKIQIMGTGFTNNSAILFNGKQVAATFVSSTEVDFTLTTAMVPVPVAATQYSVQVTNPAATIPVLN